MAHQLCPGNSPVPALATRALLTHRVVLQFAVVHVDDVGADAIQEVLGVGYQHKDPLEPVAPRKLLQTKSGEEIPFVGPDGDKDFICMLW